MLMGHRSIKDQRAKKFFKLTSKEPLDKNVYNFKVFIKTVREPYSGGSLDDF